MHGLINKAIQCFVLDTYGRETWREMAQSAALPVMQFEAMLIYEDTLTEQALDATARLLDSWASPTLTANSTRRRHSQGSAT